MDPWVEQAAAEIERHAERELEALVGVSSPSGDVPGAEEAVALCVAFAPAEAEPERLPCSTAGHADDLALRLTGSGTSKLLLLGHLDTVVANDSHRPIERTPERLIGSGTVDMKGGVVLALGTLRALAARAGDHAELALLLVVDEEWRTAPFAHAERFAGWDGCLCFEAGERREDHEAVVVRRKAAGALRPLSGAEPEWAELPIASTRRVPAALRFTTTASAPSGVRWPASKQRQASQSAKRSECANSLVRHSSSFTSSSAASP